MKPSVCAIIPARAGSKGVPHKNLRPLAGKPLLGWSVEAACQASCVSRVLLSTDSWHMADVGIRYGAEVPFLRPRALAGDASPVLDAVDHLLTTLNQAEGYAPDYVLLLQPTSPLRTAEDIEYAFARMKEMQAEAILSVCEAADHPLLCRQVDAQGTLKPFLDHPLNEARRQDLPPAYAMNGALYLVKTDLLLKTRSWAPEGCCAYVMTEAHSVDIDTELDFKRADWMMKRMQRMEWA